MFACSSTTDKKELFCLTQQIFSPENKKKKKGRERKHARKAARGKVMVKCTLVITTV